MNLTVLSPPPFEPVTLAEVYAHLRIDPEGSPAAHPHDAMLARHIATARMQVEAMARRSLVQQTLRLAMPGFPTAAAPASLAERLAAVGPIRLYRPPVVRVIAAAYFDADNAEQIIDAADYYLTGEQVPQVRFASGFAAPTLYERADALRIDYLAGYTPDGSPPTTQAEYAANVPAALRDAVLLGVQLLYDRLTPADRTAIENMREALVQPWRVQLTV